MIKKFKTSYKMIFVFALLSFISILFLGINNMVNAEGESDETIILSEDVIQNLNIAQDKKITIDLNGHTFTTQSQSGTRGIINRGTLIIKATNGGTITNGSGDTINDSYGIIDNYGTLIIEGGTFVDNGAGDGSSVKNRGGIVTVNGGDFISKASGTGNACIYSDGDLSITDGIKFNSKSERAYVVIVNSGNASIGNIDVQGVHGAFGVNSGTVTINGGTYKAQNYYGIWITNDGNNTNVTINNGDFTGRYGLYASVDDGKQDVSDAHIIINGGSFTGNIKSAVAVNKKGSEKDWGMTVKGGIYSTDNVIEYVAEGYSVYTKDNKYIVDKAATITANDKIYVKLGETSDLGLNVEDSLRNYITTTITNPRIVEVTGNEVKGLEVGTTTIISDLNNGSIAETEVTVYDVIAQNDSEENKKAKEESSSIVNEILNGTEPEGVNAEIVEKVKEAVQNNKVITTEVSVLVDKEKIPVEDKKKIENLLEENSKVAQYYDINVLLKVDEQEIGRIFKLDNKIPITIEIPKDLPEVRNGFKRIYKIIRIHEGKAEELEVTDNDNGTLTFITDRFSTYALVYTDIEESIGETQEIGEIQQEKKSEILNMQNPNTGDIILIFITIFAVSIVTLVVTQKISIDKKNRK